MSFKAIELEAASRQRTGREYVLQGETRQSAIDELLTGLSVSVDHVRVDPTRTLVEVDGALWTLVPIRSPSESISPSLRRGGAKHKNVR